MYENLRSIVANVFNYVNRGVSNFEIQSIFCIYFRTNNLGKDMNFIPCPQI